MVTMSVFGICGLVQMMRISMKRSNVALNDELTGDNRPIVF